MCGLLNVLLVDDSEDDYVITRDLFSETNDSLVNLEWVTDYDTALQRMSQRRHDVYIFDYYLGQHTGLELLEWAVQQGIRSPVIILTGQKDRAVDLEVMKAGATDYLVKGGTDSILLERTVRYASEHARRLEVLRDLAIRDELTGLYNRRQMDRLLEEEVTRCLRYNHPLSLIILDIDNFKSINDTYGHLAGDQVLRSVARMFADKLRASDSIARYGGDELAVILPETSESGTLLVAERMRLAVAAHDFTSVLTPAQRAAQFPKLCPTISMGVACASEAAYTAVGLFAAADQALYRAKRSGRNQTVSCSTVDSQLCRL
ncbi:MAG TPA: GGDEF domain-containing response regulator [Chloroflexia bacterium]|jgi:diguanylate cyclase (GGDEF)-like protein